MKPFANVLCAIGSAAFAVATVFETNPWAMRQDGILCLMFVLLAVMVNKK